MIIFEQTLVQSLEIRKLHLGYFNYLRLFTKGEKVTTFSSRLRVSFWGNFNPRYLGRETELAKLLLGTFKGHGEISLKMWSAEFFSNSTKTREGT